MIQTPVAAQMTAVSWLPAAGLFQLCIFNIRVCDLSVIGHHLSVFCFVDKHILWQQEFCCLQTICMEQSIRSTVIN